MFLTSAEHFSYTLLVTVTSLTLCQLVSAASGSLLGDKIVGVSFLGPLVTSLGLRGLSVCLSLLVGGWCLSVYGPPKTAQLNPQIEAPTPHLHIQLQTSTGCVCVHCCMCLCGCVCG